jgi:hypothetical protein
MNNSIYEVKTHDDGSRTVFRTDPDGKVWLIPTDPANMDYAAYLAQLEVEAE